MLTCQIVQALALSLALSDTGLSCCCGNEERTNISTVHTLYGKEDDQPKETQVFSWDSFAPPLPVGVTGSSSVRSPLLGA
jgi:hypothetical protein